MMGAYGEYTATLTSDFCMGRTEVTVAAYRQCRSTGACTGEGPWPVEQDDRCNYSDTDQSRDDHPVNCVTYEEAREHCQAQGGDLPTEAQWSRAAQGDDRRVYPWGSCDPSCSRANYDVNGSPGEEPNGLGCAEAHNGPFTWTVGSAPEGASPYGLLDMAGNVAEYVRGCYGLRQACEGELGCIDPVTAEAECDGDPSRLVFGSSAESSASNMYLYSRGMFFSDYSSGVGMRCVVAPLQ